MTPEEEKVEEIKIDDKELLKNTKWFMFNLCEYIIKQTENNKTRLRLIDWDVCWDEFTLKRMQYKNWKQDFILNEYKIPRETSLNFTKDLTPFYDLFINKIF